MELLKEINEKINTDKDDSQLELLLFRLEDSVLYGVNVFKAKEILVTPSISPVPKADKSILGLLDLRGKILTAVDMASALDLEPQNLANGSMMLYMEFSRQEMCFVIKDVERIVYYSWSQVQLPPSVFANNPYITGIANFQGEIVQVIDVEKILSDVMGEELVIEKQPSNVKKVFKNKMIIGVDDSKVARRHLKNIFEGMGVNYQLAKDGVQALELLNNLANTSSTPVDKQVLAVVSDVEMPEMDGYSLVKAMKASDIFKAIPVILNSSLSESVAKNMANKVGADDFLMKWVASDIVDNLKEIAERKTA